MIDTNTKAGARHEPYLNPLFLSGAVHSFCPLWGQRRVHERGIVIVMVVVMVDTLARLIVAVTVAHRHGCPSLAQPDGGALDGA